MFCHYLFSMFFLIYHCFRNKYSNWVWLNSHRNLFLVHVSGVQSLWHFYYIWFSRMFLPPYKAKDRYAIISRGKNSYSLHLPQEVTIQIMKDKWLTVCNLSKINSYGLDWLQFRYDCLYADKISFILTVCNNYNSYGTDSLFLQTVCIGHKFDKLLTVCRRSKWDISRLSVSTVFHIRYWQSVSLVH